jgi:single-strand DNA-binding protein
VASLNKVQLIGNLGRDPELRYSANSQAVANFSMATSRSYKKNDEWQEETEWHSIVMWGDKAERFVEQCHRGSRVYVEGYLKTRSWEDKELKGRDGNPLKHYKTDIVADRFINLSGKGEASDGEFQSTEPGGASVPTPAGRDVLEDLPF